jgi:hypothetical protein
MIFAATWEAVLNGTKTETRRICKPGGWLAASLLGAPQAVYVGRLPHERLKWMVGRTYAIQQGRGQKAIGRIRLLEIRQERLQDIDEAGAVAEGCQADVHATALNYYRALWDTLHGSRDERWTANPLCWVLRFELAEATNG